MLHLRKFARHPRQQLVNVQQFERLLVDSHKDQAQPLRKCAWLNQAPGTLVCLGRQLGV
jgi:hypothetical protein